MTIGLHLYLVLRNGISEPPEIERPVDPATYRAEYDRRLRAGGHPFWPDAIWRDILFGSGVLLLVVACALIIGPRVLGLPPDPSLIAKDPRPDWYMLLRYFALLAVLPPTLEDWLVWLLPLAAGAALIALPLAFPAGERHPARRPWAWGFVACALVAVTALLRVGIRSPWTPAVDAPPFPAAIVASSDSNVIRGAALFHEHACESCHRVSGYGGVYGPDLTYAGDRLSTWISRCAFPMALMICPHLDGI